MRAIVTITKNSIKGVNNTIIAVRKSSILHSFPSFSIPTELLYNQIFRNVKSGECEVCRCAVMVSSELGEEQSGQTLMSKITSASNNQNPVI